MTFNSWSWVYFSRQINYFEAQGNFVVIFLLFASFYSWNYSYSVYLPFYHLFVLVKINLIIPYTSPSFQLILMEQQRILSLQLDREFSRLTFQLLLCICISLWISQNLASAFLVFRLELELKSDSTRISLNTRRFCYYASKNNINSNEPRTHTPGSNLYLKPKNTSWIFFFIVSILTKCRRQLHCEHSSVLLFSVVQPTNKVSTAHQTPIITTISKTFHINIFLIHFNSLLFLFAHRSESDSLWVSLRKLKLYAHEKIMLPKRITVK